MPENGQGPRGMKAVIFDYGEVLCHQPKAEEIAQLADFFGIAVDKLAPLWEKNRGPFDRGDLSAEKYWTMFADDAGVKMEPGLLEQVCQLDIAMWSDINDQMVDWVKQLRSSGMKIGLLSNMHPDMVTHCRKNFPWIKDFDFATFSGEVRLIKPDPAIYEHTLRGLGVKASEAIFLDDREVNIKAARDLGIRSIRVQSAEQLRRDLQAAGFTLLPAIA
jgi:putative hydrolase of the HAD superfamily